VDARLAKITPGRKARFAGKQTLELKERVRTREKAEVMPGRPSGEVRLAAARK